MTVIIECISRLINVTYNNDARWKPEINCDGSFCTTFVYNGIYPVEQILTSLKAVMSSKYFSFRKRSF